MTKVIKNILLWIIIGCVLEMAVFIFVDKYYLKADTNFISTKVDKDSALSMKDTAIRIPDSVQNVSISFNGKYAAYMKGNSIEVINLEKGDIKTLNFSSAGNVIYYEWFPDMNRMIIAERNTSGREKKIKLLYYDVRMKDKMEMRDFINDKEVFIPVNSDDDSIEDIAISTETRTMYVKVIRKGQRNEFYRMNRMYEIQGFDIPVCITGRIAAVNYQDRLLYEDIIYNKIGVSGSKPISIPGSGKSCLLKVDNEDRIYAVQSEQGTISKIYYGNIKEDIKNWDEIILQIPVSYEELIIDDSGRVFIDFSLRGIIKDNSSGVETDYTGKLITVCSGKVYSIGEGKLYIKKLN